MTLKNNIEINSEQLLKMMGMGVSKHRFDASLSFEWANDAFY